MNSELLSAFIFAVAALISAAVFRRSRRTPAELIAVADYNVTLAASSMDLNPCALKAQSWECGGMNTLDIMVQSAGVVTDASGGLSGSDTPRFAMPPTFVGAPAPASFSPSGRDSRPPTGVGAATYIKLRQICLVVIHWLYPFFKLGEHLIQARPGAAQPFYRSKTIGTAHYFATGCCCLP